MEHTATASRFCSRGRWSALNIVLMIVGFAVFWPLGLAMLAWIVWGDEIGRRTGDFKDQMSGQMRAFSDRAGPFRSGRPGGNWSGNSGNAAFDAYRDSELKRLDEERRKIESMRAEFETFAREVRRAKDQEEFDRFMQDFRNRTSGGSEASAS